MPVENSRRLRGQGGSNLLRHRYAPLPPVQEVPSQPSSSQVHSEVRLNRGQVKVRTYSSNLSSPINRPCMRYKSSQENPERNYGSPKLNGRRQRGRGLINAVTGRGRGYQDLDNNLETKSLGSRGSSLESSPKTSPNVSPKSPKSGILITSAIARSGIKRLSRVSFGSSKGSMVETLIYDSPLTEDDRILEEEPILDPVAQKFGSETGEPQKPASKVRVTFFECDKPLPVTSPEPESSPFASDFYDFNMTSQVSDTVPTAFDRQMSSDSGCDNPFRPDGDISREADEIVQMIKSGVPLNVSQTSAELTTEPAEGPPSEPLLKNDTVDTHLEAPPPTNNQHTTNNGSTSPGTVEIKHRTVSPSEAAQVEHVVLKKKKKCCCVVQ